MKIDVTTLAAKKAGDIELDDAVFGLEPRADILHRMVRYQLAKRRAGTHSTLERGEVAGLPPAFRVEAAVRPQRGVACEEVLDGQRAHLGHHLQPVIRAGGFGRLQEVEHRRIVAGLDHGRHPAAHALAEAPGEGDMGFLRQGLIPEEDHLVLQQRLADFGDDLAG